MTSNLVARRHPDGPSLDVSLASAEDGVRTLLFLGRLQREGEDPFTADAIGDQNTNGWGLYRLQAGWVVSFICNVSTGGFEGHGGFFYGYLNPQAAGRADGATPWPGVEFGEIPNACLIDFDTATEVLLKVLRSGEAGLSGGFTYDAETWRRFC